MEIGKEFQSNRGSLLQLDNGDNCHTQRSMLENTEHFTKCFLLEIVSQRGSAYNFDVKSRARINKIQDVN